MSHISSVQVTVTDKEALLKALKRLGLVAEVHEAAVPVLYRGHARGGVRAHIVVRQPFGYHADLGFELRADKTIATYTDTYYQAGKDLVNKFTQAYGVEKAKMEARKKGFLAQEKTLDDGTVRLTLRRF